MPRFRGVKQKAARIMHELAALYPISQTILRWRHDWQLLVAVMLSAQTTDKKVNEVTPALFAAYRSPHALARARVGDIERIIRPVNYYKTKARHIKAAMRMLDNTFDGRVPATMRELVSLPGVGRKTANVVLGNLFDIKEGIAVDTHVRRLVRLWGLTDASIPAAIERDLLALIPERERHLFTNRCIDYGREHCTARCRHVHCPLRRYIAPVAD